MNHEDQAIVDDVDGLNEPPSPAPADNVQFLVANLTRIPAAGVTDDRLNLGDRAAVLCRVFKVPIVPFEPAWHWYHISIPRASGKWDLSLGMGASPASRIGSGRR